MTSSQPESIQLERVEFDTLSVLITGTSPLITHRWSEAAKQQMLDKMQGRKSIKLKKDPEAEYLSSMYMLEDGGYGMPTAAFKAATVGAARLYDKSVTMTALKQQLRFKGDGVESRSGEMLTCITTSKPTMREDTVRVGSGGTDLRYRAMFAVWSATLKISFPAHQLDRESVAALVDAGGAGGVGEWRPQRGGSYGTYEVEQA